MAGIIRKHIVFHGRVQGVGFRYRAYYTAQKTGLTGWVKNCPDGSVEMEIQGMEEQIDQMILSLDQGTYITITGMEVVSRPVEKARGFEIRN